MGAHAVGAMVVSGPDGFAKGEYRLYNVENTIGDDYAILREVLTRRIKRLKDETSKKPDLMIIDGGKGHLSVAKEVMDKIGIKLYIISMSKGIDRNAGKEVFHLLDRKEFTLDRNLPIMKYLQILRDEAHNFAISSHRKKRSKAIQFSSLDKIEKIGKARKKALLKLFR
jgi:excinuclease ABC subunit C